MNDDRTRESNVPESQSSGRVYELAAELMVAESEREREAGWYLRQLLDLAERLERESRATWQTGMAVHSSVKKLDYAARDLRLLLLGYVEPSSV